MDISSGWFVQAGSFPPPNEKKSANQWNWLALLRLFLYSNIKKERAYSKFNSPKNSGQWNLGCGRSMGDHERKWGV